MITLVYEPIEEQREFAPDKIIIKKESEGQIDDYLIAFRSFLSAAGFTAGTIERALPTLPV